MFYDIDFIEKNKNLCLSDRVMLDRWASRSPASVPMDNLSEKAKNVQVGCWECPSVFPKMVENESCQISQKNVFIYPCHALQKYKLYDQVNSQALSSSLLNTFIGNLI